MDSSGQDRSWRLLVQDRGLELLIYERDFNFLAMEKERVDMTQNHRVIHTKLFSLPQIQQLTAIIQNSSYAHEALIHPYQNFLEVVAKMHEFITERFACDCKYQNKFFEKHNKVKKNLESMKKAMKDERCFEELIEQPSECYMENQFRMHEDVPDPLEFLNGMKEREEFNKSKILEDVLQTHRQILQPIENINLEDNIVRKLLTTQQPLLQSYESKISFLIKYSCVLETYFDKRFLTNLSHRLFENKLKKLQILTYDSLNNGWFREKPSASLSVSPTKTGPTQDSESSFEILEKSMEENLDHGGIEDPEKVRKFIRNIKIDEELPEVLFKLFMKINDLKKCMRQTSAKFQNQLDQLLEQNNANYFSKVLEKDHYHQSLNVVELNKHNIDTKDDDCRIF